MSTGKDWCHHISYPTIPFCRCQLCQHTEITSLSMFYAENINVNVFLHCCSGDCCGPLAYSYYRSNYRLVVTQSAVAIKEYYKLQMLLLLQIYFRFTSKYVSPVLCTEEISSLDTIDKKDVNFTVSDNMENSTSNAVLTTFYIQSSERMSNLEIIFKKLTDCIRQLSK